MVGDLWVYYTKRKGITHEESLLSRLLALNLDRLRSTASCDPRQSKRK